MKAFSYGFVAFVFIVLALSFIVSTASIISEFRDTELIAILSSNSYLFVFFPTLGIVALAAFYIPAVVFTDLYIRHAPAGAFRLLLGTVLAVGGALYFADDLNRTQLRAVWEVSPAALEANQVSARRSPVCLEGRDVCIKPILDVLGDLRDQSLDRIRISPFIRNCSPDKLMEADPNRAFERHCFPTGSKLTADQCCRAKDELKRQVFALWANPETRSRAAELDRILLPFKSFFIIVIMLIGVFLITWKKTLRRHYKAHLIPMERGLLIGAVAMLLWPVMDYAYQQTSDVLYGPEPRFPLRLSLVVVPWALLLTGYFADKTRIELARLVQIVGTVISGIALLRYQDISDWSSKLVGLGANLANFVLLIMFSAIVLGMLLVWLRRSLAGKDEVLEAEPEEPRSGTGAPLT